MIALEGSGSFELVKVAVKMSDFKDQVLYEKDSELEEDWRLTRDDGFSHTELLEQQRERGERIVSSSPDSPPGGGSVQPSAAATPYPPATLSRFHRLWRSFSQFFRKGDDPAWRRRRKGGELRAQLPKKASS